MAYNRLIPACLNLDYSLRLGFVGSLLLPVSQAPYQLQYYVATPIAKPTAKKMVKFWGFYLMCFTQH